MVKNVIIGILAMVVLFIASLYAEECTMREYWRETTMARADEAEFYRAIVTRVMFADDEQATAAVVAAATAQANEYDYSYRRGWQSGQQAKACAHDIACRQSPIWRD